MCGTARRGADALPGSKATSRAKGSHRNLGGLASGRRCRVGTEYDGPHREGEEPKPMMHGHEKSDFVIVAVKPANKAEPAAEQSAGAAAAESVERRAGTKGNADQQSTYWTQSRARVSQALERIRQLLAVQTRGGSRMRESRTYGSGRGACDETHVPTATAARVHHAARRRAAAWPLVGARAAAGGECGGSACSGRAPMMRTGQGRSRRFGRPPRARHGGGTQRFHRQPLGRGDNDSIRDAASEPCRAQDRTCSWSTAAGPDGAYSRRRHHSNPDCWACRSSRAGLRRELGAAGRQHYRLR